MDFISTTAAQQAAGLAVLGNRQTKGNTRLAALVLAEFLHDDWTMSASVKDIAQTLNTSELTASKALRELEALGIYEVDRSTRPATYKLVLPLPTELRRFYVVAKAS